jgi:hypothetical protein
MKNVKSLVGAICMIAIMSVSSALVAKDPTLKSEDGSIPAPPTHSGMESWGNYLTTVEAGVVSRIPSSIDLPDGFDKKVWGGWFASHAAAMISEPAAYARWAHDDWLRVVTAYGVFGTGNFYDPLVADSRGAFYDLAKDIGGNDPLEKYENQAAFLDQFKVQSPFFIFSGIKDVHLLKDYDNQDALLTQAEKSLGLLFSFMPPTHRDAYIQLGKHVLSEVSQPGWYEREYAYHQSTLKEGNEELFTRYSCDGKADPFRKGVAFVYRRVCDKTVTVERAIKLLERVVGFVERENMAGGPGSVHDPKLNPEKESPEEKRERFFDRMKRLVSDIAEKPKGS